MPHCPFEITEDEINKQIYKEFKKTEEDLENDVNILRTWAVTQPHFPEKPSDRILRFFIVLTKFSIEKAKKKLDMYYTIRSLMPEYFKCQPLSPEMALQGKTYYIIPLPKTAPDFKRIIYSQVNPNYEPEFFIHERVVENFINVAELLVNYDKCYGIHFILDCIGAKLGHITKFSVMALKKTVIILEKVFSNRVTSLYIVNQPPILDNFINNIFKPVLPHKIRNRVTVHSDSSILLRDFGQSVMPKDIGGEEKSLEELYECQLQQFKQYKDRFDVLGTLRVDESLRPEKLVNDDILGYYGNFKHLNLD